MLQMFDPQRRSVAHLLLPGREKRIATLRVLIIFQQLQSIAFVFFSKPDIYSYDKYMSVFV